MRPSFWPVSAFDVPSLLSLIIFSFWLKWRDVLLFLLLEHLEAIINWPNFKIVLSQGIGRPGEREKDRGTDKQWSSQNKHNFYWIWCLMWVWFMVTQNNYSSNIIDHWSQATVTNIIIMKTLEILQELPKCWYLGCNPDQTNLNPWEWCLGLVSSKSFHAPSFWVSTMSKTMFQLSSFWHLTGKTRVPHHEASATLIRWTNFWGSPEEARKLCTVEGCQRSGILLGLEGWKIFPEREGERVCPGQSPLLWLWDAKRKCVDVIKTWGLWIRQNCVQLVISPLSALFLCL